MSHRLAQQYAEGLEHEIARRVAILVINLFEVVHVEKDKSDGLLGHQSAADPLLGMVPKRSGTQCSGEFVILGTMEKGMHHMVEHEMAYHQQEGHGE